MNELSGDVKRAAIIVAASTLTQIYWQSPSMGSPNENAVLKTYENFYLKLRELHTRQI